MEVGDEDCEPPSRFVSDMLSSIGDGRPREMISLCSNSSELMECFCRMSGPVIDLAMSGLGKSLKLVCCREGIPPSVSGVRSGGSQKSCYYVAAAALPARSSFCSVCVSVWDRLLHTLSRRFVSRSLWFVVGGATTTESAFRVKPVKRRERSLVFVFRRKKHTRYSRTLAHNHESRINGRMITNELTACGAMLLLDNRGSTLDVKYCFLVLLLRTTLPVCPVQSCCTNTAKPVRMMTLLVPRR